MNASGRTAHQPDVKRGRAPCHPLRRPTREMEPITGATVSHRAIVTTIDVMYPKGRIPTSMSTTPAKSISTQALTKKNGPAAKIPIKPRMPASARGSYWPDSTHNGTGHGARARAQRPGWRLSALVAAGHNKIRRSLIPADTPRAAPQVSDHHAAAG